MPSIIRLSKACFKIPEADLDMPALRAMISESKTFRCNPPLVFMDSITSGLRPETSGFVVSFDLNNLVFEKDVQGVLGLIAQCLVTERPIVHYCRMYDGDKPELAWAEKLIILSKGSGGLF